MIDIDGQQFGVISAKKTHVLLTLPVPPSANRYWRMAKTHIVVSQEAQDYKQLVRLACAEIDPLAKGNDVAVSFTIYRARKAGDLDNYTKILLDALKGVVYADDDQVVDIHAKRDDDKENPRVVLEAWKVKK